MELRGNRSGRARPPTTLRVQTREVRAGVKETLRKRIRSRLSARPRKRRVMYILTNVPVHYTRTLNLELPCRVTPRHQRPSHLDLTLAVWCGGFHFHAELMPSSSLSFSTWRRASPAGYSVCVWQTRLSRSYSPQPRSSGQRSTPRQTKDV